MSLTLLTFNIAHGRGLSLYQGFSSVRRIRAILDRIAELLVDTRADIVALQEVDECSHWNGHINLLHHLQDRAGFDYAYMGVNNRRDGRKRLAYGNAVLSRFPLRFWENNPFGQATLGEKGFLYTELDIRGHPLPLVNLHLDYRSRARRIRQVEQVLDYLRRKPHPGVKHQPVAPIICGDFNTHSKRVGDAVSHLFEAVLGHGEYGIYPHEAAATFPALLPHRALDFIFLPAPCRLRRCEVIRCFLSDHRPVLVEFSLTSSRTHKPQVPAGFAHRGGA